MAARGTRRRPAAGPAQPGHPAARLTTYDAKDPDTTYPPTKPLRPPPGAPNVLLILVDDVGFGASSAFGGPYRTPNFERLADDDCATTGSTPPRCARRPGRRCSERSPGIPAWDDVDPALKPALARQMEVYAGYLENTDHHVGLLLDALEDLQILNDTLIYLIIGDNGASAEGSLQGTFTEMITLGGFGYLETPTRSAGPTPWTRPTSGPSRWPPTGAAPATAPSSTGRAGSRPRARSAASSTT